MVPLRYGVVRTPQHKKSEALAAEFFEYSAFSLVTFQETECSMNRLKCDFANAVNEIINIVGLYLYVSVYADFAIAIYYGPEHLYKNLAAGC
jgi:hypothetical protein